MNCVIFIGVVMVLYVHFAHTSSAVLSISTKVAAPVSSTEKHHLTSFVDISFRECKKMCIARPSCAASEYRYLAKYCTLWSTVPDVVRRPGVVIVSNFDETRQCGMNLCRDGETCNEETGSCFVAECDFPNVEEPVNGNRFSIGSTLTYVFQDNLEQISCTHDGLWQNTNPGFTCHDMRLREVNVLNGIFKTRLGIAIYCDFETDGGDWLVFQRRQDGSEDFYRDWREYRDGFGNMDGEFWFGLENLHTLLKASPNPFELRIDLEDWDGNQAYAVYDTFSIDDESEGYRLHCGNYAGTAGNSINDERSSHNGHKFSTFDRDNDENNGENCAVRYHGAWWYHACFWSNLNGEYLDSFESNVNGILWLTWRGLSYSLKKTSMKIREKQPEFTVSP